jgi:LL-diaminopimelate aminotransferase
MIKPSVKLEHLTTSVFSQLAEKKNKKVKLGYDMVDLSIGSPDLPPPAFIKERLAYDVMQNDQYGYPLTGTDEFKEAVSIYYKKRFGVDINTSEVLQLMGSQDGLSHLTLAYLDPGDIVIVPDPGYPIYSASVRIAGAELYTVPLNDQNDFMPNLELIPQDIRQKAKMMILSYPGNPVPSLAGQDYLEQVIEFGKENQILIVHDFAYSELIFDDQKPISILSIPGAKEIAVEFNSLSKSFNMAGCRIGYLVGRPELIEPLAVIKSHIDYGVFYPIQKAASLALTSDYSFLAEHRLTYQKRRDAFVNHLHNHGWNVRLPQGGMFVWAKLPEGWTSLEFAMAAIEVGVIVTPGQAFGDEGEGYVRIALVHDEARLIEAADRLKSLIR